MLVLSVYALIGFCITTFYRKDCMEMLGWVLTFFVLAIIAAIFGFTGIAVEFAWVAKILFYAFLVLLVLSAFLKVVRKQ